VTASRVAKQAVEGRVSDPITTEVIRHGLLAAAEHMKLSLRRTAFSPVIYEMLDFACALFDRDIRLLAQAEALPVFLGTLGFCVESTVRAIGGPAKLAPGDVLFSTYGYDIGSHQQDAAVVVPAYVDGELVGYAAVKGHHLDIGAKDPYCTDTTDIFQEGTIFPGVKLYAGGELQSDMYRTLLANSRLPKFLAGDLNAEIGAAKVGLEGLYRLIQRYGQDKFGQAVEEMFDHGEAIVRQTIAGIPEGVYRGQGLMDNNGVSPEEIPFEVVVEVKGGEIVVDYRQSPPEQPGPINCPLATTVSASRIAIMSLLGGGELANEGHFRPLRVLTTPGTMFDPRPPAPMFLFGRPAFQAIDAIHHALAPVMPEVVAAGSGGDICPYMIWGHDGAGELWVTGADYTVGQGATYQGDAGAPLMHIGGSGERNTPAEVWETRYPFLVEKIELAPDSGGAGRHRGGLGIDVHYRALAEVFVTCNIERTKLAPWGLFGGRPARANSWRVRNPDGTFNEYTKITGLRLPAGAVVELSTGGGGGYGDPSERDPEAIRQDVREGYVTAPAARREYVQAFSDDPAAG
jgi:N-methylhydantoinase B